MNSIFLFNFSLYNIILYFFLYSFVGWCIEVVFCSINTGKFVNRGFLNGPVCPIYGFGAVFVIIMLTPIQSNFLLLFVFSVLVTSLLELITGFILQKLFKTRWWDYSKQPFNIGGYICLKFSLAWGIACVFLMRIIHPFFANLINLIPLLIGYIIISFSFVLFLVDLIVTVNAVLKLNRDLGELSKISKLIHNNSESIAKNLGNTAIKVADKLDKAELESVQNGILGSIEKRKSEFEASVSNEREKFSKAISESRAKMSEALDMKELKARRDKLLTQNSWIRKRLFKSFPDMKNINHQNSLDNLKSNQLKEKNDKKD